MRILFIGDVVGAAGMTAVKSMLPDAISRWEVDLAVVNGENSAPDSGLPRIRTRAFAALGPISAVGPVMADFVAEVI